MHMLPCVYADFLNEYEFMKFVNFSRYTMHKIPNIVMKHTVYAVGCAHVLHFFAFGI